jgi:hypothetical protein
LGSWAGRWGERLAGIRWTAIAHLRCRSGAIQTVQLLLIAFLGNEAFKLKRWREQPVVDGHKLGKETKLGGSFVAFDACCIEATFCVFDNDVDYKVEVVWQKNFVGFDLES